MSPRGVERCHDCSATVIARKWLRRTSVVPEWWGGTLIIMGHYTHIGIDSPDTAHCSTESHNNSFTFT